MSKVLLVLCLVFFFALPVFAQQVDTAWVRRYNGPVNGDDYANAIAVDGSGNVYVTGNSLGSGTGMDYATIKYYSNGDTAWVRRYNGQANGPDEARALAVDGSGNVYVTGTVLVTPIADYDCATIKYYPNGDTAWVRRYNGPNYNNDRAYAIAIDGLGNVYVAGSSDYAFLTVKYDKDGNELWSRTAASGYSGTVINAIALDGYGNIYVTGPSAQTWSNHNYTTIKYYPNGDTAWMRFYDGPGGYHDYANDIAVDVSGNVYVTGQVSIWYGSGTNYDFATVKYDQNGNVIWANIYYQIEGIDDQAFKILLDGSGNAYVTGISNTEYTTIKYSSAGDTVWVSKYNSYDHDIPYDMTIDIYGNVYVTGFSGLLWRSDCATVKYSSSGDELWVKGYGDPNVYVNDGATAIAVDGSGNVYIAGGTGADCLTIKYWQNYPPNSFALTSPSDSAIIPFIVAFDWETATDPDPWDTAKYDLYVSTSSSFNPDSTLIYDSLSNSLYTDTLVIERYYWKVRAFDKHSERWSTQTWTFLSAKRGDANGDQKITVSDVIYLINYLFKGGPAPIPEVSVGDVNCDGKITVSDVIYLINYLFKGGPSPC